MPIANVSTGDVIQAADHNSLVAAIKGTTGENLTVFTKGADLPSAAALTLGTDGNFWDVTGTTNITSISSLPAGTVIKLQFDGALTLVHNATALILSGGVSYVTVAGDVFEFVSEGSGNWRETHRSLSAITTTVASAFGAAPSLLFGATNAAGTGTGFVRRNATIALFDTTNARALAFGDVGTIGSTGGYASHQLHGHPMPAFATPNFTLSTTQAEGNATTPIRSNAQIALFDTTALVAITFGDVGTVGGIAFAARRDHQHALTQVPVVVASTNNALMVASTNGNLGWLAAGDVTLTGTQTLTNKTLTAPVIADFTNAAHDHGDADDGGQIALSRYTASLGGDVSLTNSNTYYDGPAIAQGTTGTWFVTGTVTVRDATAVNNEITAQLWDGTTVIASGGLYVGTGTGNVVEGTISLSGYITNPAANLKISCASTVTTSLIKAAASFNGVGNNASTISAVRVA